MPTDQDLVKQILERNTRAFETLLARYQKLIRRHLRHMLRNDAAAQDLLQEVFLRVWTRAEQWDGRGSFKAWLYRIATNLALNHLRTVRRRRERPLVVADEWDDEAEIPAWMVDASATGPDTAAELSEWRSQLQGLVDRLPQEKREVFRLVHEMEMSMRDVADELGIPEGTVKSRLHYAKSDLAREWRELNGLN